MNASPTTHIDALTVSEQLDAMLAGWLEHHAALHPPGDPDERNKAVVTVAEHAVAEVEVFCSGWDLAVRRRASDRPGWAVLIVEGRALPVRGFTEITGMYRR